MRDIRDSGSEAIAVSADVASESEVVRLFQEVDAQLGPVTALVNNAGILERQMRVEEMDSGRLTRILTTNVTGSLLCAREAVRQEPECQGCGAVPGRCTPCWRDYTGRV